MTEANGHPHDVTPGIDEIVSGMEEMVAKIGHAPTVLEKVRDPDSSFEQKSHTLMMESVDKITNAWVAELVNLRNNSLLIEKMVIEQAAKVKGEMTKLHLLGVQAMREAQRGHEVLQHLGEEISAMMEQTTSH